MSSRIALVGPGRLGQAVCRLLADAGHEFVAVVSRDLARARAAARFIGNPQAATTDLTKVKDAEMVFLALPDDAIAPMATRLRQEGLVRPGTILVHFSGIHDSSILLGKEGTPVLGLAIHPMQSFADAVIGMRNLPGSLFAIEGDASLIPLAKELVDDVGGQPFILTREQKPLYHAAACTASNFLVTLVATAGEMLSYCGIDAKDAGRLFAPLLNGTVKNLSTLGPQSALTGPIVRGDILTVEKHLAALEGLPEEVRRLYCLMGEKTVDLAEDSGRLSAEKAAALRRLLQK
ncbi:MAG: Rossmann-like and DUF2520 domain-containing protein [Desulfuromonadales bacterium]|nr:Rossmann-like and DUF2520 domain-containing protein [Desulfuromonadales bacterium]MDW7757488.1 Rossmann-like and DUF2520 domain-containing protein [Desulfuromonadales bacterium]